MKQENNNEKRLKLGEDSFGRDISLPMDGQMMTNYHMIITGESGYGKTFFLKLLARQLYLMGYTVIIIDASSSYLPDNNEEFFRHASVVNVYEDGLEIDFLIQNQLSFQVKEKVVDATRRVADLLALVFELRGGKQKAILYSALKELMEKEGDGDIDMKLKRLGEILGADESESGMALALKLASFLDLELFKTPTEKWNVYDEALKIFNLQYFDDGTKKMLTDVILWDIWNQAVQSGNPDSKVIVILDEAQNLNHSSSSPIAKMLTEGRKFGIGLWISTQFLRKRFKDEAISRLKQAATRICFRPDDSEANGIAREIDYEKRREWAEVLKGLGRGECVVLFSENETDSSRPKEIKKKISVIE